MLVLTLRRTEMILINTPEGNVRIIPCPIPRYFQVVLCPGQSLTSEPATKEQLSRHGGGKNWIVIDSAAGKIRIRFAKKRPASAKPASSPTSGQEKTEAPADEFILPNCPLNIDAPHWMQIWREPLTDENEPASKSPKAGR